MGRRGPLDCKARLLRRRELPSRGSTLVMTRWETRHKVNYFEQRSWCEYILHMLFPHFRDCSPITARTMGETPWRQHELARGGSSGEVWIAPEKVKGG